MTTHKHQKTRIRARMAATGERYATARSHVVAGAGTAPRVTAGPATAPADDLPRMAVGSNPATTALATLLAAAGRPVSESTALLIGGGLGIGVFRFHYTSAGVGTFFLGGRHRWDDDAAFLTAALARVGLRAAVSETGSARTADRQLREALDAGGPVVAWLDLAELGTRAYPDRHRGGAYHVTVVRSIDDARGVAVLDDLSAEPVEVPLDILARARARIARQRHRLLTIDPATGTVAAGSTPSDAAAIRDGLRAMVEGFDAPRSRAFSLAALADWASDLRGSGRGSWSVVFPPGGRLWDGLAAIDEYVEHWGSGGGLLRPMLANGLADAAERLDDPRLATLAERYAALGRSWSELAAAALPDGVPAFRRTRQLQADRATAWAERGTAAHATLEAAWEAASAVRAEVEDCWPLQPADTRSMLDGLADRVGELHAAETAALDEVRAVVAAPAP